MTEHVAHYTPEAIEAYKREIEKNKRPQYIPLMTEQELKEKLDLATAKHELHFKNAPEGINIHEFEFYMSMTGNLVDKWSMEYRLVKTPEMSDLPDYGTLMTLEDFKECCMDGSFIDYDGSGNYATETQQSNIDIHPSDVLAGKIRTDFTHVMWFNR